MGIDNEINRRDLIAQTAGAVGAAGALTGVAIAPAMAQAGQPLPPGFDTQPPLKDNWNNPLSQLVAIDADMLRDAPELADPGMRERHRIYCHLLMKLIVRFWNGNKRGPHGVYPLRAQQKDIDQPPPQPPQPPRYRGDMMSDPGGLRVNWDRYLGHNIACIAVDGNGEIIDFDFNHNDFFRSSAEHAESRLVRRLFSLTDIFDNWRTGQRIGKPRAASLNDVTLYTTLESCAQCSGVMSLAGVKQIVYMQNDFTAYKIGNLMYKLANRTEATDPQGNKISIPGAPIPIAGTDIGLEEFDRLNAGNLAFAKSIEGAGKAVPPDLNGAFFVPDQGRPDFTPSITSFLCTDAARAIFVQGGGKLDTEPLSGPGWKFPNRPDNKDILTNEQCLAHCRAFYTYADVEGYRGSPHKL